MSDADRILRLTALLARVQERALLPREKHEPAPVTEPSADVARTSPPPIQPVAILAATPAPPVVSSAPEITVAEAVIDAILLREEEDASEPSPPVEAPPAPGGPELVESGEAAPFELRGIDLEVEMDPFQEPAIEVQRRAETTAGGMSSRERMVVARDARDDESSDTPPDGTPAHHDESFGSLDLSLDPDDSGPSRESDDEEPPSSSRRPRIEPGARLEEIAFGAMPPAGPPYGIPPESGSHPAITGPFDPDSTGIRPLSLLDKERELHALDHEAPASEPHFRASAVALIDAQEIDLPPAIAPGEFTADLPRPGSSHPPPPRPRESTLPYAYGMRLPDVAPGPPPPAAEATYEEFRAEMPTSAGVAAIVVRPAFAAETFGDLLDATLSL